jgi:hypothetical protein
MWSESKALGGFARVLAWSAAIQSAIGFSSVFLFILIAIANVFEVLPPEMMKHMVSLWYLLIIIPAIGTGLVLTIHSWIAALRERSLLNMGTAAWNTFAQVHNMYSAIDGIGDALGDVGDLFDTDGEGTAIVAVIGLVLLALFGGIFLTCVLIKKYAARLPIPERA